MELHVGESVLVELPDDANAELIDACPPRGVVVGLGDDHVAAGALAPQQVTLGRGALGDRGDDLQQLGPNGHQRVVQPDVLDPRVVERDGETEDIDELFCGDEVVAGDQGDLADAQHHSLPSVELCWRRIMHDPLAARASERTRRRRYLTTMGSESRMVFLGFGKFARADRIYALEPLRGDDRGDGRRTKVWVDGLSEPIIASRTERTILQDMGQGAAADAPVLTEALDLARHLAAAVEAGHVDLGDLGRRARHLLASTTVADDDE